MAEGFKLKATSTSSQSFDISIETPATENASILLYDIDGKMVLLLKEGFINSGEVLHINLDTKNLQSGLYLVSYRSATRKESINIIVKH